MGKWWGLLFGVTMLFCLGIFIIAPFVGWWLPEGVSTHSGDVDFLFYIILAITGFFFVATEGLLVYFLIRFGSRTKRVGEAKPPAPPFETNVVNAIKKVIPNEHRLELAWTIVPAAILLYIAVAQIGTWAEIKYQSSMPSLAGTKEEPAPLQIGVSARQFEWRMRYPSPETFKKMKTDADVAKNWAANPQLDDVHVVNELHVFTNEKAGKVKEFPAVVAHLSTIDVQHNFNLPHFRVKQDALPGKLIPVWFRPTKSNGSYKDGKWEYKKDASGNDINWEIACAELCGRWHFHMIARVYVHPSEEDFLAWLKDAASKDNAHERSKELASK